MIISYAVALFALFIASICDIRKREVPDFLSYGMIFFGLLMSLAFSYAQKDFHVLLYSLIGAVSCALISLAMFFTGQWGGGDAKVLTGIGAIVGLNSVKGFLVLFIVNALIVGAVYSIIYTYLLAIINFNAFKKSFKLVVRDKNFRLILAIFLGVVSLFIISIFFILPEARLLVFILVILLLLMFMSWLVAHSVQEALMKKKYPVSRLTEGDWVYEDVFLNNRRIYKVRKTGILSKDIEKLKKYNVRFVKVKEGIPFVPSFFIAFVVSMSVNWLTAFF